MVTYRRDLEKKHWHRPWPVRIVFVVMGVVLVLAGLVAWSLEDVYGGDPNRQEYVIGHEVATGQASVFGENGELVYETVSIADAEAWVEGQRGSRSYTVPVLLIAGGAFAIIAGLSPSPRQKGLDPHHIARAGGPPATAH